MKTVISLGSVGSAGSTGSTVPWSAVPQIRNLRKNLSDILHLILTVFWPGGGGHLRLPLALKDDNFKTIQAMTIKLGGFS